MIFSIDTTGEIFSACLLNSKSGEYSLQEIDTRRKHGDLLPLVLDQLLAVAEKQWSDLEHMVLVNGPGSFTGLRVGASFVKGLLFGTGMTVSTCSRLQAMLYELDALPGPVLAALDAKRSQVYCRGTHIQGLEEDMVLDCENLLARTPPEFYFTGNIPCSFIEALNAKIWHPIPHVPVALAAARLGANGSLPRYSSEDAVPLLYLRQSQAEEERP